MITRSFFTFLLFPGALSYPVQAGKSPEISETLHEVWYHKRGSEAVLGEGFAATMGTRHSTSAMKMYTEEGRVAITLSDEITPQSSILEAIGQSTSNVEEDTISPKSSVTRDISCLPLIGMEPSRKDRPDMQANLRPHQQNHRLRRRSRLNEWRERLKARLVKNGCKVESRKWAPLNSIGASLASKWTSAKMYFVKLLLRLAVWLEVPLAKPARFVVKRISR